MNKILILIVSLGSSASIGAAVLPDAVDLKAAYCIPIARSASQFNELESIQEPFRTDLLKAKEKAIVDLRRLQLYLTPRIGILDSTPLIGAAQGAKDDQERVLSDLNACLTKTGQDLKNCVESESDSLKRVRSCNNLDFLPF